MGCLTANAKAGQPPEPANTTITGAPRQLTSIGQAFGCNALTLSRCCLRAGGAFNHAGAAHRQRNGGLCDGGLAVLPTLNVICTLEMQLRFHAGDRNMLANLRAHEGTLLCGLLTALSAC